MRLTIEKLVYGGAGLARTGEGVVFVPRTAPGDVVDVEIVERKADYSLAQVQSIIEPSPDRQSPTCPNYPTAGCCHWQHIRYERQVEIKQAILSETLQRVGRIRHDEPMRVITGPDANYRLRAVFHVRDRQVGFMEERSRRILPIQRCSALVPELNEFIAQADAMLVSSEMAAVREVRAVAAGSTGASFVLQDGKSRYYQFGAEPPRVHVNGFVFAVHPDAFFQSNRYLLGDFMNEVMEQAGEAGGRLLDLFCGGGFFSLPLARRAERVLGIESGRVAIRQALLNSRLNSSWNVEFFHGRVDQTLRSDTVVQKTKPDLVLLNPPRTGCGRKTAESIAALRAPRIVYVSCNPSTFAAEAAVLLARGYTLRRLALIDQFPNTYHIELAATFDL